MEPSRPPDRNERRRAKVCFSLLCLKQMSICAAWVLTGGVYSVCLAPGANNFELAPPMGDSERPYYKATWRWMSY